MLVQLERDGRLFKAILEGYISRVVLKDEKNVSISEVYYWEPDLWKAGYKLRKIVADY